MKKKFAKLQRIDNDHRIVPDNDFEFLYHLQNSLLLALKEQGRINTIQYQHTEERLKQQRRDQTKNTRKGDRE